MYRIKITEPDEVTGEPRLIGHFDYEKVEKFKEDTNWDGNNHISVNTGSPFDHQTLLRTASGRWVLEHTSQWQGTLDRYEYVTDETVRDWLILNDHEDAVKKHFGSIEDERGPNLGGRPAIGNVASIAFGDVLPRVDEWAKDHDTTRAQAVRTLLESALNPAGTSGIDFIAEVGVEKAEWLAQPASLGTTETRFTDLGGGRVRFDANTLAHLLGLPDHVDGTVSRDEQHHLWMWIGGSEHPVWVEV